MTNLVNIRIGKGRTQLHVETQRVGKDWCIHVTGGKGHIGACALGSVDPKSGRAFASLITLSGHKEGEWTLRLAERLAGELTGNVLITMGIHLDRITPEEIGILSDHLQKISAKLLLT
ncbi:MAG: hypothetical protein HY586_06450 [Candidatus Omnitrophica bacterium]|nr:hypothetical protein [Candidatus Omnitrophota bacterium]